MIVFRRRLYLSFEFIEFVLECFKEVCFLEFILRVVKNIKELVFTDIEYLSFGEGISIFGYFLDHGLDFSGYELELFFEMFGFGFDVAHGFQFFESTVDDVKVAHKFFFE